MWSSARLALVTALREWALIDLDLFVVYQSPMNGSVAFFKSDIDNCDTDEQLLEMLHKRLDVPQPRK